MKISMLNDLKKKNFKQISNFIIFRCLDFVAMSMCGGLDNPNGPTDEEFESNIVQYSEVIFQ